MILRAAPPAPIVIASATACRPVLSGRLLRDAHGARASLPDPADQAALAADHAMPGEAGMISSLSAGQALRVPSFGFLAISLGRTPEDCGWSCTIPRVSSVRLSGIPPDGFRIGARSCPLPGAACRPVSR